MNLSFKIEVKKFSNPVRRPLFCITVSALLDRLRSIASYVIYSQGLAQAYLC